jgi:hypothetical protein
MSTVSYLFLEFSTVGLFGLLLWHAARRGRRAVLELLTAAVFGLLLEWGNMLAFETYTYSSRFVLMLGTVPVVIGLCWAMIIYGAMLYSDRLGLPTAIAPFADAVWAIVLDLAFDAIAIRLQLWTWTIPLTDGFFGVPAGNFHAWLYVALGFSAWTRWARSRPAMQQRLQILAPLGAYVILIGAILFFDLLVLLLYPASAPGDKGMAIFVVTLALFVLITGQGLWRGRRDKVPAVPNDTMYGIDVAPTLARWAMHGYFGAWLIGWLLVPELRLPGMDLPIGLFAIAGGMLVVEALMLVPPIVEYIRREHPRFEHHTRGVITRDAT